MAIVSSTRAATNEYLCIAVLPTHFIVPEGLARAVWKQHF